MNPTTTKKNGLYYCCDAALLFVSAAFEFVSHLGKLASLINPLTPKLYSFQTTFSICMPTPHHIFISVRTLTPKLNPNALAAIISRLITLTTPTH